LPLDWDQRHTFNSTAYFDIEGWGLSLIYRMSSGQPYTPSFVEAQELGLSSLQTFIKNKGRKPIQLQPRYECAQNV
jgi:hypothetical protein